MASITESGQFETIDISIPGTRAANPAFDVTPARYVTGITTDKEVIKPERGSILAINP